jgi:hypothetical protein
MGHSAKKKTVTVKFDLLLSEFGNYEIAKPGTETKYFSLGVGRETFSFNKAIATFCKETFQKAIGIELRKGEVAELEIKITRK